MSREIVRYEPGIRVAHWLVAITFMLAALSGLAFFHPSLFWFTNLFGGGTWTRILHPFIGVFMAVVFFLGLAARVWSHNRMTANDRKWLGQWRDVLDGNEDKLPEVGKYNGGQKMMFWVTVWSILILLVSGVLFWRPWFAHNFPVEVHRVAVLLHAVAATVVILSTIVHVYAAIWVKGTFRAMMRGTVTEHWARKHHAAWHREVTRS
jgi:formate dehydrogenase subunit gamma